MEALIISALMTVAGSYFAVRNIQMFRDPEEMAEYIRTSPKAKLWVKKFGEERTIELSRKYFIPLGTVVACFLTVAGGWSLWQIAPQYFYGLGHDT